ncbi:MAG TPA: glycosyltransferase family 2 protein [Baekduia sp.]|uniref:glycosyltransferase family 2 protein n=1 Tax=Baekduia sp. TaxID=2600305 RepID=UPI002B60C194|nr:glycosyltransferase family 2 protein [Baekduia sp.]HMJ32877.1 glycosyltransferase family 2 protein [Baekduia sp.]
MRVAVVVPNRDGRRWLPGLLESLRAQTRAADRVVIVDDGSRDDSVAWLRGEGVEVVVRPDSGGFAAAVNAGLEAVAECEAVALVNTDVALAPDWLSRTVAVLEAVPTAGSVATKMVAMDDPATIDDAGDALRRDGVCEQRGRGRRDAAGRFDVPGEVWGACAGAALYRRRALDAVGGFDASYGMYLEDVDVALRLRLAGWTCRYEPAVARHAGAGSGAAVGFWVARNTLVLVARWFPWRWAPYVAYRQASWLVDAARRGALREHLRGLAAALPLLPGAVRGRARRRDLRGAMERAVPARPWRGARAGGHPEAPE